MLLVRLTDSEDAASTPTPNTVVYLGKLDTGLVFRGHLTWLEPGHKYTQRQLRYIEWKGVKIYDFQKVNISTLFKLYIAGLDVLIPKRYHMLG